MVKIVIPIEESDEERSLIFPHFGRAPNFAIIDLNENGILTSISHIENTGEHFGGHGKAMTHVSALKPDILVVKGMGQRGLQAFQSMGITVLTGDVNTVREAITAYSNNRLVNLTKTCGEAQH
ncbi:NifB/NifX family molybdenum-iron cluster-binding protein [Thermoproteota archaeon]